jgi:hypothetical protein
MDLTSRANPVDEVIPVDSSVSSLVDVDSGVSVVESNFLEKEVCLSFIPMFQAILTPPTDTDRDSSSPYCSRRGRQSGSGRGKEGGAEEVFKEDHLVIIIFIVYYNPVPEPNCSRKCYYRSCCLCGFGNLWVQEAPGWST